MSAKTMKLIRLVALVSVMCWVATAAFAGPKVPVTSTLTNTCSNCRTDADGADPFLPGDRSYSLTSDNDPFAPSEVRTEILTNNSVYTLDTTNTLVDGLVAPSTRTVLMHFYSSVEGQFPGHVLPPCWNGNYDQDQAVNWSVMAPVPFPKMSTGTAYQGFARLNFNVRTATCDRELNRFRVEWPVVCITHPNASTWIVTSDACGATVNYGTAHLEAYGGQKRSTVKYGDWRLPFRLTLTK